MIASSDKLVEALTPPVPLELLEFGVRATLRALGEAALRDVPPSPDGGLIADYHGQLRRPGRARGPPLRPRRAWSTTASSHPELVSEVIVGEGSTARTITIT